MTYLFSRKVSVIWDENLKQIKNLVFSSTRILVVTTYEKHPAEFIILNPAESVVVQHQIQPS